MPFFWSCHTQDSSTCRPPNYTSRTDAPTAPNTLSTPNNTPIIDAPDRPNAPSIIYGPAASNVPTLSSPPSESLKILSLPFLWQSIYFYDPNINVATFSGQRHSEYVIAFFWTEVVIFCFYFTVLTIET